MLSHDLNLAPQLTFDFIQFHHPLSTDPPLIIIVLADRSRAHVSPHAQSQPRRLRNFDSNHNYQVSSADRSYAVPHFSALPGVEQFA